MSGLKLVPRIPKWPSTMNGSEAPNAATTSTGQPPSASRQTPLPCR